MIEIFKIYLTNEERTISRNFRMSNKIWSGKRHWRWVNISSSGINNKAELTITLWGCKQTINNNRMCSIRDHTCGSHSLEKSDVLSTLAITKVRVMSTIIRRFQETISTTI